MRKQIVAVCVVGVAVCSWTSLETWGGQGHRLVGLSAANHLSAAATRNVTWLLDGQSLAEVSSWSDGQVTYFE